MTGVGIVDSVIAVAAVVALGWVILLAVLWFHRPSRELIGPTLRIIPDLVRLVRALLSDPTTPRSVRFALVGLLAYLLAPIDLVPDFLPAIGAADDLILAAIVLRWAGRRVGVDRLRDRWPGDEAGFDLLRRLLGL